MHTLERGLFIVGQYLLLAVCFIARRDHDAGNERTAPARLEQTPGAADIGFEGGQRITVGDRHDRLRREMKYRVDLIFSEHALQQPAIGHITPDSRDFRVVPGIEKVRAWNPIANNTDHVGAGGNQILDDPRTEEPGRASHENAALFPQCVIHGILSLPHPPRSFSNFDHPIDFLPFLVRINRVPKTVMFVRGKLRVARQIFEPMLQYAAIVW